MANNHESVVPFQLEVLLALAITSVVAATASAEPIRVTEDENNNIDFSFDPEDEGNIIPKDEEVDALRHLAKRSPIPPFDPFTKTKKKFKKFVVKPKKLKKLVKKLPKAVPFAGGLGLGGAGGLAGGLGLGSGSLPTLALPAFLGGGGGTGLLVGVSGPPLFNSINRALG